MDKLYFVLVVDKKVILPSSISILSVLENIDKGYQCIFFIYAYDFKHKPESYIKLEKKYHCKIKIIPSKKYDYLFDKESKKQFINKWIPFDTYHRLLIFKYLPSNVKKVTYLDTDVVFNKNVTKLISKFPNNKLLGAVVEVGVLNKRNHKYSYLKDNPYFVNFFKDYNKYPYFNAGLFIANIKLGKKLKVFDEMRKFIKDYHPKLADQDTLNAVIGQKHYDLIKIFKPNYNVFAIYNYDEIMNKKYYYSPKEVLEAYKHPSIIHYSGIIKPWTPNNKSPFKEVWYKYKKILDNLI